MSEQASWALIGYGTIGQEIERQIQTPAVAERLGLSEMPTFVMRSSGMYVPANEGLSLTGPVESYGDLGQMPDLVFVALPSTDDGLPAAEDIQYVLDSGSTVVTAEKGALANFFEDLQESSDDFKRFGINATVGGGTRMIEHLKEYCHDRGNVSQLHFIGNGTLNEIFSSIAPLQSTGLSLGQAVERAINLGYAEPGAEHSHDVIRSEAEGDIPKKTAILFNALGLSDETINWNNLVFKLTDEQIVQVIEEASERRFIVSIYSKRYFETHGTAAERDVVGGFRAEHEGWHLVGGFRQIKRNPLFSHLATLGGPSNGFVVGLGPDETDGVYSLSGPGAGPKPTVNTMLDDWYKRKRLT